MSAKTKAILSQDQSVTTSKIRITLTSRRTDALESAMAKIVEKAQNMEIPYKGPRRFPTRILRITTRKSPCGEGTNTWDRFEMRIHKRVIEFYAQPEKASDLASVPIEHEVKVELLLV